MGNLLFFHFISIASIIVIYVLAPVNSNSIMLSEEEIKKHKEVLKYILVIYLIMLLMFIDFRIENEIVAFLE